MEIGITPELIQLYEEVGDDIWSPSDISPELKPKIKQWISNGQIHRISRRRCSEESKYRIDQRLIAKITAEKILQENTGLYLTGTLSLRDLSHTTGLETKYLSRRLNIILQNQGES